MRAGPHIFMVSLIALASLLIGPVPGIAAQTPESPGPAAQEEDQVSFLLVLVDEHEFGEHDGVIRTFGASAEASPHLQDLTVVLLRSEVASPATIHNAARVVLTLRDGDQLHGTADRAIPFGQLEHPGPPSDWAERAYQEARSARTTEIPGVIEGRHPSVGVGVSPYLLRER